MTQTKKTKKYNTTHKTENMSNTDPTNNRFVNTCAREGQAVPSSY